jgi:hypothetical protein
MSPALYHLFILALALALALALFVHSLSPSDQVKFPPAAACQGAVVLRNVYDACELAWRMSHIQPCGTLSPHAGTDTFHNDFKATNLVLN